MGSCFSVQRQQKITPVVCYREDGTESIATAFIEESPNNYNFGNTYKDEESGVEVNELPNVRRIRNGGLVQDYQE